MGLNFRGLATQAAVAQNEKNVEHNTTDVADVPASVAGHTSSDPHGLDEKIGAPRSLDGSDSEEELNKVDTHAEAGVQKVQAMTYAWSKNDLILAYALMWIIEFVLAFSNSITSYLTTYVVSDFQEHSLTALTSVIASLVGGLWKLPYAKIINIIGRPQGLCIGILFITLGLIMMAGCNNVQTYCAAQVFYWVGYNSIDFSITVFIADTSKLKNRGFFIAYASSPFLITVWVFGYALDDIIAPGGIGFRWGFGIFAIIVPLVCVPFLTLFFLKENKARKEGLIEPTPSRGTFTQAATYYFWEFDVIGLLIFATGLSLFLLSFNIYSYQKDEWKSPLIICFIIFGALLIIAFGIWEKFFAPVTFVPWHLLKNRTVIFTYTMAFSLYMPWYIWDSFFYSLNLVLFNQSVVHATYIGNIYTMGSCTICIVYGILLRYYGKLKMYSLFWGVPLTILGVGLMIKFREPDVNIGYIVMCQIFVAFGGGVLVTSEQTTLMAVSKQQDFPALLAVESMVVAIASAVGSTIATALWTGIFPVRLAKYLPADAQADLASIYGDVTVQLSYAWGTPTRDAINRSYAETQRYMLITATCLYSITLVSVALWQNVDVRKQKQRTIGLL